MIKENTDDNNSNNVRWVIITFGPSLPGAPGDPCVNDNCELMKLTLSTMKAPQR